VAITCRHRHALRTIWLVLAGLPLPGAALAQTPLPETVTWSVSAPSDAAVKPGSRVALTVHGTVLSGWHVYALKQNPLGPTPLRIALDANDAARADGAPTGSPPTKTHDAAFNLETRFYSDAFTLTVPVRLGSHLPAGQKSIPLRVQFQTCNGQICQPPKTVHLSAQINLQAGG
jgi:hypothetical protein